jgi:hypothetical protein
LELLWKIGHALGVVSTPKEKAFRAAIMQDMQAHPEEYPGYDWRGKSIRRGGGAASRAGELANAMGKTKDFVTIAVTAFRSRFRCRFLTQQYGDSGMVRGDVLAFGAELLCGIGESQKRAAFGVGCEG